MRMEEWGSSLTAKSVCRFVEIAQSRFPQEFSDANETAIQEVTPQNKFDINTGYSKALRNYM